MTPPPAAIVTDIEGTTTRIAFVHEVLFPYARARLEGFLRAHADRPDVAAALADTARLAPGIAPLAALLGWMDQDAKIGPLKAIQGMIWNDGYAAGALTGELYPDVAPCLRRWRSAGVRLFVYSSGSVAAQKLLFRHSSAGDLEGLFSGFFDTGVGPKREAASYACSSPTCRRSWTRQCRPGCAAASWCGRRMARSRAPPMRRRRISSRFRGWCGWRWRLRKGHCFS
jgi:enolase-phosphatase E1